MQHTDLIDAAATLTAALLKPIDATARPDVNAEGRAAVHAVELFMKVWGAMVAKFPQQPEN